MTTSRQYYFRYQTSTIHNDKHCSVNRRSVTLNATMTESAESVEAKLRSGEYTGCHRCGTAR